MIELRMSNYEIAFSKAQQSLSICETLIQLSFASGVPDMNEYWEHLKEIILPKRKSEKSETNSYKRET